VCGVGPKTVKRTVLAHQAELLYDKRAERALVPKNTDPVRQVVLDQLTPMPAMISSTDSDPRPWWSGSEQDPAARGDLVAARFCADMTTQPATTTPTIESLLDADQVAERLGVKPRFVRRLVEERRIPFCKLGKFVRFRPSDIDAWLDTCTVDQGDHLP